MKTSMIIIHNMNDNHTNNEFLYRPRWLGPLVRSAVQDHPVVILTGARQTGKSTFLRNEKPFSSWRYISLDDFDVFEQAERDPQSLWAGTDLVVIDEVQKSPKLLSAIKLIVDKQRSKIHFVLSGSANLLLLKQVSESLAGRAVYFNLLPMSLGEMLGLPAPDLLTRLMEGNFSEERIIGQVGYDTLSLMLKGFMPPLLTLQDEKNAIGWWEGYTTTYLERDLRQISQVSSLVDFRRVMVALALRSGQLLNQTEVSRDTGVPQPTISRYLNLLETTCIFERVPAFTINRTKRLIKTSKPYWIDPALAVYLAGYHDNKSLETAREVGCFFETLVFLHLKAVIQVITPRPRLYYWRTTTGKEVDFIIEWGRKLLAAEAKFTAIPQYGDIRNLRLFLDEYPEAVAGMLIYSGQEIKRLDDKIVAVPWHLIAGIK